MSSPVYIDIRYRRDNFLLQMKEFIPDGIIGIFGPSGSGKSSLLKLLAGIENPDEGQIIVRGHEFYNQSCKIKVPVRKRKMGLVFQEGRLFPHMSIRKNLLYGYSSASAINFQEVVELLEIGHLLDKKPDACSGGEKQRVAIGRMLLSSPEVLMLDEPFSALDQRLRRNIIPYLIKIHKKFKLPILVVSHDLSDLLMLSDQLVLIDDGQIKGIGSYFDLILNNNIRCCLYDEPIINSIKVEVKLIEQQNGILSFQYNRNRPDNLLVTENVSTLIVNDRLFFNLFPEDISLSLAKVEGISVQNQLEGQLKMLKEEDGHFLCLVDVGYQLLVRVTSAAASKLKLKEGMKLFCLFKTSAIKNLLVVSS